MKKLLSTIFCALCAISMLCAAQQENNRTTFPIEPKAFVEPGNQQNLSELGLNGANMLVEKGLVEMMPATDLRSHIKKQPTKVTGEDVPVFQFSSSQWGVLNHQDGTLWYYTQTYEADPENTWYYATSTITLYDNTLKPQGSFTINAPEGWNMNSVQPFGVITTDFFDKNSATWELFVYVHGVNSGKELHQLYVMNSKAETIQTYDGYTALLFDAEVDFKKTRRMFIVSDKYVDGKAVACIDIYKNVSWGETVPSLVKTWHLPMNNLEYSDGSFINMHQIGDELYYTLSYYEKPFMSGYDEATWEPIVNPDNNYIMTTYDMNTNEEVASIKVSTDAADGALYSFRAFGFFSYFDLTKDYNDEGELNYIVTRTDYISSADEYVYAFEVYNTKGELIKTIVEDVVTWVALSDIYGCEKQYAFVQQNTDEEQQMNMINLPSGTSQIIFPAYVDEMPISTYVDRVPVGDSYQYLIGVNAATYDEDFNIIARIGWYTLDYQVDHYTTFNLGPQGELFIPALYGTVLNPYLFNTDDGYEFLYRKKIRTEAGSLRDFICIANEEGKLLREFAAPEGPYVRIASCDVIDADTDPKLLICFYDAEKDVYDLKAYSLPFEQMYGGGDGTAENPYVITSVGDLQLMNNSSAHFVLGEDLYMGREAGIWKPIENFTGHFDGRNKVIREFTLDADGYGYAGLFGDVSTATIKNLVFDAPEVYGGEECLYLGVLAGIAMQVDIENVHVFDAVIDTRLSEPVVGGLVGQASAYSNINSCSVQNLNLLALNASVVGGIAGDTRTSACVNAALVTGQMKADHSVGGIVGNTGSGSKISDCRTQLDMSARYAVGAIVGESGRAPITRVLAAGNIEVTDSHVQYGYAAGGIVGRMESDWSHLKDSVLTHCVADVEIVTPEGKMTEVAGIKTIGRVVGFTIADEEYAANEETYVDEGIYHNYALKALPQDTETLEGANTPNGAYVKDTELNEDFFKQTLGYTYGEETLAPWKGAGVPQLYFEDVVTGLDQMELQDRVVLTQVIAVYDLNGRPIVRAQQSANRIMQLPKGVYVVVGQDATGTIHTQKVFVE